MLTLSRKSLIIRSCFLVVLLSGLLNTAISFGPAQRYNLAAFEVLIYGLFLFIVIRGLMSGHILLDNFYVIASLMLYLATQGVLFAFTENIYWLEFLVAYKWVGLFLLLQFVRSKHSPLISAADARFIISIFFFKYIWDSLVFGVWRPGLFGENNFEQPFVFILISYIFFRQRNIPFITYLVGAMILMIGGSKSTIIGVISGMSAFIRLTPQILMILAIALPLILLVITFLVVRELDFSNIDRVRFALAAYSELTQHSVTELLFGTWPLKPLSQNTCQSLSFYKELITSMDQNICYSRVFHGFLLRITHDTGLVSLIVFPLIYRMMRRAGVNRREGYFIMAIILANSLSVSGLNNIFIMLSLAIIIQGGRPCAKQSTAHI